jgi:hypothetical protein
MTSEPDPGDPDQVDPYPRRRMAHRSPARWLAPLALLICALAVYLVVHASLDTGNGAKESSTTTTRSPSTATTTTGTIAAKSATARSYTVRAGDVLSAIAVKTGVTVDEIQKLNPSIDARTLRPGQKLRLRP